MNTSQQFSCPSHGSDLDKPEVRAVLISLFSLVFLCCCFGNVLLLAVIAFHKGMRTVTNFFLANLAIADLFVGVFCVLQYMTHVHIMANGVWPLGDFLCRMYVFTLHFGPCASAGILILVSAERYIAVLYPVVAKDLLTKRRLAVMTILTWILSIAVNIPFFYNSKTFRFGSGITTCGRDSRVFSMRDLVLLSFCVWYVAPLAILIFIYSKIGYVLCKSARQEFAKTHQRAVRNSSSYCRGLAENAGNRRNSKASRKESSSYEYKNNTKCQGKRVDEMMVHLTELSEINGSESARVKINGDHKTQKSKQNSQNGRVKVLASKTSRQSHPAPVESDAFEMRKKVIRLLVAVIVAFAVLTLPQHIRLLYINVLSAGSYQHCNVGWRAFVQPFAYFLLFVNSAINPILYAFLSERFRVAVRDLVSCTNQRERKRKLYLQSMRSGTTTMSEVVSDCG